MKVLLVNPPAARTLSGIVPPALSGDAGHFPPLGLLYVAAHARTVPDTEVECLDAVAEGLTQADLARALEERRPDVVGVEAMTFTLLDVVDTVRTVRSALPGALLVVGGPHATLYPRETADLPGVDAVVTGEGEYAFAELLRRHAGGEGIDGVAGVLPAGGRLSGDEPIRHIGDLDALEWPARDLLPVGRYRSPMAAANPVTTMMSSRGCPGKCVFCDRPQMGKAFRKRSARSVVDEMVHCKEALGIGEIVFYDDTFTIDRPRVMEICRRIGEVGLDMPWDIRARVDTMTPEMLAALKEAGCHRIHYGVETGSPLIQKRLRKNLDLARVEAVFRETRACGIETLGYFMIGCPDETEAELEKTMDALVRLPMDYAHISLFTPYPGTEIYREALERGVYEADFWASFAAAPTPEFRVRHWNQFFTDEALEARLRDAYRRFYRRPAYLFERLREVRSFRELLSKARVGVRLLAGV